MAYVPKGQTKDDAKEYGGYEVNLIECSLCGNLYAEGAEQAHSSTVAHAAAKTKA